MTTIKIITEDKLKPSYTIYDYGLVQLLVGNNRTYVVMEIEEDGQRKKVSVEVTSGTVTKQSLPNN